MSQELKNAAINYLEKGFSIIPVSKFKRPILTSWAEFQKRLPTKNEVEGWFKNLNPEGIAVVTGKISGIVVLDLERSVGLEEFSKIYPLPITAIVRTGGQGRHYLLQWPGYEIRNGARIIPGWDVDFRGDGGFALLPPSAHQSGNNYEWVTSLENKDMLAEMPDWLKSFSKKSFTEIANGVSQGSRNNELASYLGKLRINLDADLWPITGRDAALSYAKKCMPPMSDNEALNVFRSISNYPGKESSQKETVLSGAMSLEDLCKKEFPPQRWIVQDIFTVGSINQISGAPNNWKTWTTQHIGIQVASGKMVFGHYPTKQCGVLIVNEEDDERLVQERSRLLEKDYKLPVYFHIQKGIKLTDDLVEQLIREIKEKGLSVIIFDSLSAIHSANEKEASEMNAVFDQMQKFVREGFTVIFTHHHRKKPANGSRDDPQEQTRGSTVINARITCHIVCEEKEDDNGKLILITQAKLKAAKKLKPFKVRIKDAEGIELLYDGEYEGSLEIINRVKNEILDIASQNDWLCVNDYIKMEIGKKRTIQDALRQLAEEELIEVKTKKRLEVLGVNVQEGKHNKKFYRRIKEADELTLDT